MNPNLTRAANPSAGKAEIPLINLLMSGSPREFSYSTRCPTNDCARAAGCADHSPSDAVALA